MSRFILNLRDAASGAAQVDDDTETGTTEESFMLPDKWWRSSGSRFIAPLGAPLDHSFGRPVYGAQTSGLAVDERIHMRQRYMHVKRHMVELGDM